MGATCSWAGYGQKCIATKTPRADRSASGKAGTTGRSLVAAKCAETCWTSALWECCLAKGLLVHFPHILLIRFTRRAAHISWDLAVVQLQPPGQLVRRQCLSQLRSQLGDRQTRSSRHYACTNLSSARASLEAHDLAPRLVLDADDRHVRHALEIHDASFYLYSADLFAA